MKFLFISIQQFSITKTKQKQKHDIYPLPTVNGKIEILQENSIILHLKENFQENF